MATSSIIKNMADGTITFKDGTGTPIVCTVRFDNADFSVDGLKAKLRETNAYQHRGVLSSVRHTTRTFPTFSMTCSMSNFTSAGADTVSDAILKNGAFAAAVSTLGANADVYTLDVTITEEGTTFGDAADHAFSLEDCELSMSYAEGDPNTFSISGTCYGAVTGDLAI
jgi:hypothetical protein